VFQFNNEIYAIYETDKNNKCFRFKKKNIVRPLVSSLVGLQSYIFVEKNLWRRGKHFDLKENQ